MGDERVRVLIDEAALQRRIVELAAAIRSGTPDGRPVHVVAVLKGAFVFMADLIRAHGGPATCDFMAVASYGPARRSSGDVRLTMDLAAAIEGRDVVLVEDIVDTGLTLRAIQDLLRRRHPRSLRTVCLLDKPSRRAVDVAIDHVGFTIGDRFVVGYGLDLNEHYRHLPFVGVLAHATEETPHARPAFRADH